MSALFLSLWLALPAAAADKKADAETVKLVSQVVKVDIPDIPPEAVEAFLAVDPETLPKKLRKPFEVRKIELYTARQLALAKKKSNWRSINKEECSLPKEAQAKAVGFLMFAGYGKVTDEEIAYVEKRSGCTQRDMMCEFTLQIILEKQKDRKEPKKIYLLHTKDALMAYVSELRAGMSGGNTNFFGTIHGSCTH